MCSILPINNQLSKFIPLSSAVLLPTGCLLCGSGNFKKNGTYPRKLHIGESKTLYPVPIQRCYCYGCKHTFSLLPEWISPRRWYIWKVQEQILQAFILFTTIRMISKQYNVARSTVSRWLNRFKDQFNHHADQAKQLLPNILGRTNTFISFWKDCLSHYLLEQIMRHLSNSGLETP